MILPYDWSRCTGTNGYKQPCDVRGSCKRYLAAHEDAQRGDDRLVSFMTTCHDDYGRKTAYLEAGENEQ